MAGKIINGRAIATEIKEGLKKEVANLSEKPGLAIILVGENPASQTYVRLKQQACKELGINSEKHNLPETATENEILEIIEKLNNNNNIHGIVVQLPLPQQVDTAKILSAVDPAKDVDGFHPQNLGGLLTGTAKFESATSKGILKLIEETGTELEGQNVCLVGWGMAVGKPLSNMLLARNATLTVCHEFTKNLAEHIKNADIIISAAGVPKLIKEDDVKDNVVVIDAGCSKQGDSLVGDVDFEAVKEKASWITPVPGGVGPMTIAMLLSNVVEAAKKA